MVYAFMEDLALTKRSATARVELVDDPVTAVGFFDDKMANSFLNPGAIRDIRAVRIPIDGIDPYTAAISGMTLHFDVDTITNNADAAIDFNDATSSQLDKVFNICELVYLSQGVTIEALEVLLLGSTDFSTIYQAGSVELSPATVEAADIMLTSGLLGDPILVHKWIQFSVSLTTLGSVTFKVWLGRDAFEDEYPISTITKIMFPCAPAKLLNPSDASIVHAVASAASYVAEMLPDEVANKDHTGTVVSGQNYYNTTFLGASSLVMDFEVFYKGRIPTSNECRVAIVAAIGALIDLGGYGTIDDWMVLFPSLYVDSEWYLIPLWSNTTTNPPTDLVIISGISSYGDYQDKLAELFPSRTAEMPDNIELLKAASSEVLIATFPGATNTIPLLSNVSIGYAPYQTDPGPGNELSTDLISFTTKLAEALAFILGTTEVHTSTTDTIDGHVYESFTVGAINFHVLTNE